jgi:hypothetical protein
VEVINVSMSLHDDKAEQELWIKSGMQRSPSGTPANRPAVGNMPTFYLAEGGAIKHLAAWLPRSGGVVLPLSVRFSRSRPSESPTATPNLLYGLILIPGNLEKPRCACPGYPRR